MKAPYRAAFLAVALACSVPLAAREPASIPYEIQWDRVEGAGGYVVEVQDESGKAAFNEQFGPSAQGVELVLPPGPYRFRIVTLNNFLRAENSTEWVDIRILEMAAPKFVSLEPRAVSPGAAISLTLRAELMTAETKAALIAPSGARVPLAVRKLKDGSYRLTGPALAERGSCALVLTNPPNLSLRRERALEVEYPVPVPAGVALNADAITVRGSRFSPEALVELVPELASAAPAVPVGLRLSVRSLTSLTASIPPDLPAGRYAVRIANAPDLPRAPAGLVEITRAAPPASGENASASVSASATAASSASPESSPGVTPASAPDVAPANGAPEAVAASPGETDSGSTAPSARPAKPKKEKGPVRHRVEIGAAVSANAVGGKWAEVYPALPPTVGASLSADWFITNNLRPRAGHSFDFSLGLRAAYSTLSNAGDARYVRSDLFNADALLCPAVTLSFRRLFLRYYAGGGLDLMHIEASQPYSPDAIAESSLYGAAGTGISVSYPFARFVSVGASVDCLYAFSPKPFPRVSAALGLSLLLPLR